MASPHRPGYTGPFSFEQRVQARQGGGFQCWVSGVDGPFSGGLQMRGILACGRCVAVEQQRENLKLWGLRGRFLRSSQKIHCLIVTPFSRTPLLGGHGTIKKENFTASSVPWVQLWHQMQIPSLPMDPAVLKENFPTQEYDISCTAHHKDH